MVVVVPLAPAGCGSNGTGGVGPPVAHNGSSSGTATTSTKIPASSGLAGVAIAWYWTIENARGMYGQGQIEIRPDVDECFWAPLFPTEMSPLSEGMLEEGLEEAQRTRLDASFEPQFKTGIEAPAEDDSDVNPNGAIVQSLEGEERAE